MGKNNSIRKYAFITTVEASIKSFMLPYVKELKALGFEAHLICNYSDDFFESFSEEYLCHKIDLKRGFDLKSTLGTIVNLYKYFRSNEIEVVEYGTENAAFCAAIASKLAGVPIRIYDHWGARYVGLNGISRTVSKLIERTAAFFSTNIRQVSLENMELCVSDHIYKRDKVKVLGKGGTVGVDMTVFDLKYKESYKKFIREKYEIPQDTVLIGYVGRIQSDKGINELLEAFRNIQKTNSNVSLMLVGPIDEVNPVREELFSWAQRNTQVCFTGRVSEVFKYMSAFDVLVHPTYREGFGMVLQEAAAMKIPIITTSIMGPREFIQDNITGALVPPCDENSLREKILELINDKKLALEYAEANYKYTKENFERSVMVKRIVRDRLDIIGDYKS